MLGHYFRFRLQNTQNQAITASLVARFWKFSSTGSIEYSLEQVLISAQSVAATTGTFVMAAPINNSANYIGAELTLLCTAGATTNGTGTLSATLERSTDAGATWPSAGQGEFVGAYTVTAADTTVQQRKNLTVD